MQSDLLRLNSIRAKLYLFYTKHLPPNTGKYLLRDQPLTTTTSYRKAAGISEHFPGDLKIKKIPSKPNQNAEAWAQDAVRSQRLF